MMPFMRRIAWALRSFAGAERGTVMMITGFGLLPALLALGLSVDLGRTFVAKNTLSRAVDAAALAGARAFTEDEVRADARRYFDANFRPGLLGTGAVDLVTTFNALTGRVEVTAHVDVPMTFMSLAKIEDLTINARAVALREMAGIELALALDVTGSMAGSKLTSLKTAANELLEAIYGEHDELEDVAISIVPFNSRVNVGSYGDDWLSEDAPVGWTGCMQARAGSYALDDTPPAEAFEEEDGSTADTRFVAQDHDAYLTGFICPSEQMLPLTASRPSLEDKIDDLTANGATRIDMGLRWGWRTISPRWKGLWGNADLPNDEPDKMHKVLVIMTDGENVAQFYDEVTANGANDNVEDLCQSIKDEGISIFSVTFQAPSSVKPMMRDCASSEGQFFDSPTNGALEESFGRIGAYITKLRLAE